MSIDDLIQRPVETLPPDAACTDAAKLMRDQHVGAVVVAEAGEPLGIITDRDLAVRVIAERRDGAQVTLREVMSAYPIYLSSHSSLESAVRTMRDMGVRRIPIVDERGHLDGMLALDDVVTRLGRQLGTLSEAIETELSSGYYLSGREEKES